MKKYPNYKGYLYANDDCFVNFWNLARFDKSKIWYTYRVDARKLYEARNWYFWWETPYGVSAVKRSYKFLPEKYKNVLEKNWGKSCALIGFGDIAYVPAKFRKEAIEVCDLLSRNNVFIGMAVPTLCSCLDKKENWEQFNGLTLWRRDRKKIKDLYSRDFDFVHPIKFSKTELQNFIQSKVNA
jgi:hypothetical protein